MTYELAPAWSDYYKEKNADTRKSLLDAALAAAADDGANAFRQQLFAERYPGTKPGSDAFVMRLQYQLGLYQQKDAMFTAVGRDTRKTERMLHLDRDSSLSGAEQAALYWELRNAAACYLDQIHAPGYGTKFLGLKRLTEEEKHKRMCEEIWSMSRGAALYAGEEKRLALYCDALKDELLAFDPSLEAQYQELDDDLVRTLP